VTVTAKGKEGTVKLTRGEALELKLDYTGGTGFTWEVAKIDKGKLKPQGKPTVEQPKQPRPGAKTKQVFRFTAEAAGKTDLELVYKRPFEKDKPPAKTYRLAVEIE
jgi:inhibitor of cysteine peptidase